VSAFVAQGFRPRSPADFFVQAHEDHIEVVEVSEILLEAGQRGREPAFVLRVERDRKVGDLSGAPDADPQPVKTFHRRTTPGLTMRLPQEIVGAGMSERDGSMGVTKRPGPRQTPEPLSDVVQEAGLPFRSQERPQQFAPGARVVLDADPVARDPFQVAVTRPPCLEPLEQRERDVPVANPTDQAREPFDPHIERVEEVPLGVGEQGLPEREPRPEPTHLPMQSVQTAGRRVGGRDDLVDRPRHLVENPGDLPSHAFGSQGVLSGGPDHSRLSRGAVGSPT